MSEGLGWTNSILIYKDIRVIRLLILGFSSGLPILLIFSTLSLWLKSAGLDRSTITLFSWAGLAYSFKFLWAPIIDKIPINFLTNKFGHRRSWLIVSQISLIILLISIGFVDPKNNLFLMGILIVLVGFSSATQDAIIDTYRIESAPQKLQSAMSGTYIVGYRLGMIAAGAGSLLLAAWFGGDNEIYNVHAWQKTYIIMGLLQSVGLICCLMSPEPISKRTLIRDFSDRLRLINIFFISILVFVFVFNFFPEWTTKDPLINGLITFLKFMAAFASIILVFFISLKLFFIKKSILTSTFLDPLNSFIKKYGSMAIIILLIIGFYRIADIVMGVVANLFYSDKGYSLTQIATFSKFWGLIATIFGGLIGGVLSSKYNNYFILLIGAILAAATNILFAILAILDTKSIYLIIVIIADNISAGIASVAFVAFLSSLTNINFTTSQYALFTSFMLFFPKIIGGYSGSIVESVGYFHFFIATTLMGLPVIILILIFKNRIYTNGS